MTEREKVFARLEELGVSYEVTEHPAVFTIGEMDALGLTAKGEVCKNLFLRDAKGRRHFLVVVPGEARADLRALAAQLESSKLSFASGRAGWKNISASNRERSRRSGFSTTRTRRWRSSSTGGSNGSRVSACTRTTTRRPCGCPSRTSCGWWKETETRSAG